MQCFIVAGTGTDVGKTVVSAILVKAFQGEYWKPIQCGESDVKEIERLVPGHRCYPESYRFLHPQSPHHAAFLDNVKIDRSKIIPPITKKTLIIELVGGLLVPITNELLLIDLCLHWEAHWILVSKNYLGSINHTLLTLEALQKRYIKLSGIAFNGERNLHSESVILKKASTNCLGYLDQESVICEQVIQNYVEAWKPQLATLY